MEALIVILFLRLYVNQRKQKIGISQNLDQKEVCRLNCMEFSEKIVILLFLPYLKSREEIRTILYC